MKQLGIPMTPAVQFVLSEIEESHAALDRLGVVRVAEGEKLSLSQRMNIVCADVAKLSSLLAQLQEKQGAKRQ